jgi:hypothetical protein
VAFDPRVHAEIGKDVLLDVAGAPDVIGDADGKVTIDGQGHLTNHGIAVSGPLLEALRRQVACEPFVEGGIEGVRWFDRDLCLWLHFGHVGEARFRGLEAAVPVYSLGFVEPAPGGGP